ncbi:MAG: ABC transporter substrate binding protein [Pseudolabrys sp.]
MAYRKPRNTVGLSSAAAEMPDTSAHKPPSKRLLFVGWLAVCLFRSRHAFKNDVNAKVFVPQPRLDSFSRQWSRRAEFIHSVFMSRVVVWSPDQLETVREAACYVDRILRGVNPGDLPVQLPTKFSLVVNLKTANELGLIIPESFLLFADEVIE